MNRATMMLLMCCFCTLLICNVAVAADTVLWGKQTAGTGPLSNAKTDGNRVTLTQKATISAVQGDAQGYCIWAAVTPQNPTARSVLCGGKGRPDMVGKTLSPGTYTVLPGLYGKSSANISITLK